VTDFHLDPGLVDAFLSGDLDEDRENALAYEVAYVLPWHWMLPNPTVATLSTLVGRLGGEPALLAWLARHPGVPRLVAAGYALIGLLDELSDKPAVVAALWRLRQRGDLPSPLETYMPAETGADTLASLAGQLESLLANERFSDAIQVVRAATDVLPKVVTNAAQHEPRLGSANGRLERIRQSVERLDQPT
jgi:hypothetical protein